MKVLIVDDDATFLKPFATAISNLGHEVVPTSSARSADGLSDTELATVDCAILDLKLEQGHTGLELGSRLLYKNPFLELIMLTSSSARYMCT